MDNHQRVLTIDAQTGFYKMNRYKIGDFFGPVDLGLHLSSKFNSLNIGTGLLAGSIFPGSNRLVFTGLSPCWGGFYISSMGGAGLVFDNLGINMLSIEGKAHRSSILYLNRVHGEEIQVEIEPVNVRRVWEQERTGIYALFDYTFRHFNGKYTNDPRILAVGPASRFSDIGAIGSVPVKNGELSHVDTWAGRGGFGSKLLQEHGIAAVIYGGTFIDEDFRDRKVADKWFVDKYAKKLAAKDFEATTKYRFEPGIDTGGTFGVNFATLAGNMISFNYNSINYSEEKRLEIHDKFVVNHYLKQFNEETIKPKHQKTCGEPCPAVCKKMLGKFKKDYEPYQTMGPLSGIFDQRAAEKLNRHADTYGFDGISIGGVVAWLMDCMANRLLAPDELGIKDYPVFSPENFDVVADSNHNAEIGIALLDSIIQKNGIIDLENGARKCAKQIAMKKGKKILDLFVYNSFGSKGWIVPNQYWTPGALSPMAIMGKYYMYYGKDFFPPRELGRQNANRLCKELILDNTGICRFHRGWAEEMIPEIMESLYGLKDDFIKSIKVTASTINSQNASIYWESERNSDFVYTFLKRQELVLGNNDPELRKWIKAFEGDKKEAALDFWYEMHKGIHDVFAL